MNKNLFIFFSLILSSFIGVHSYAQIITTIAGDSTTGYCCDDSLAIHAELNHPADVAVDAIGNIYICDAGNNRIRKINTSGIITTIAGTGIAGYNGDAIAATAAQLNYPDALVVDGFGNIYFSDDHNFRIRMINALGIITTIAGTGFSGYNGDDIPATTAQIATCVGIALDASGNVIFGDINNNRIRKIKPAINGIISTIAGTGSIGYTGDGGQATNATIYDPTGVAIDVSNNIFFAEHGNNCIRKITTDGIINTIAGNGHVGFGGDNGPATLAQFNWPNGLKVDGNGNIFIADVYNYRIRKVDNSGVVTTIAGTGNDLYNGEGQPALLTNIFPLGIAINNSDDLYFADFSRARYMGNTVSVPVVPHIADAVYCYPNPNRGQFCIKVVSTLNESVCINITNMIGQIINKISANTNETVPVVLNPDFAVEINQPKCRMFKI